MNTPMVEASGITARRTVTGFSIVAGLLTVGLGIAILVWPHVTVKAVAVLLAISFFGLGIVQIIRAFADVGAGGAARTVLGVSGALAVLLGFLVLRSPLQTVVVIALIVGAWWVIRGVLDIVEGAAGAAVNRGLNIALGVISVVAGAIVLLQPQLSLKVFAIVLGVWMVLYGVLLVISSILLSRVAHLSASGLWTT
ncbi:HdeD family acid-resistance protein [Mycobacterium sp.]|uniref:HdeD family acid-resistance protein n=1 Tax=Mycobacterium sp. TaxID=1785 RepID=UPI003C7328E2